MPPTLRFLQEIITWYSETITPTPSTGAVQPGPESFIWPVIRQIFLRFLQEKGPEARWLRQVVGLNEIDDPTDPSFLTPGLNDILERYPFTLHEHGPVGQTPALDPAVLGRVFEQLLALDKLEAGFTARKRTGSFYTPYPIVNYLVDESLIAYLSEIQPNAEGFERRLRHLFAPHDEPHQFNEAEAAALMAVITRLKILDPACGSGAFLVGALERLVYILKKLDPHHEWWREKQLDQAGSMSNSSFIVHHSSFTEQPPDYGWKRLLLENCLYGVDIQPIAVQITKLRLLLSLLADWEQSSEPSSSDVFNLPTLAARVVTANILLSSPASIGGAVDGFDLVIGNPPYLNTNDMKDITGLYRRLYSTAYGSYDIYILFFEQARKLAKPQGIIGFITSNKYLIADYGSKLRAFILETLTLRKLLDLADCKRIFSGALVSPCITIVQNKPPLPEAGVEIAVLKDDDLKHLPQVEFERRSTQKLASGERKVFDIRLSAAKQSLVAKLFDHSITLGQVAGVRTGLMGFAYWSVAPFIQEGPSEDGIKVVTNGLIDRYAFTWGKRVKLYGRTFYQPYLDLKSCPLNTPTKALFRRPKIIIRGVAKQLSACLDEEGKGLLVAVHCAIVNDPAKIDPKYVLALLNSRLMNWYHRVKFYTARIPEGSLRYPISFLKTDPLKPLSICEQQPIIALANQITAAKQTGPNPACSDLEAELDRLIYRLYGLAELEIELVYTTLPGTHMYP